MMDIRRGDIWFVECENSTGHEQRGKRPAIIVSNDIGNRCSPVVEVVWLTGSDKKPLPTHVTISGYGTALCEQIHTIDKNRLINFKECCTDKEMLQINKAMMISLGIIA